MGDGPGAGGAEPWPSGGARARDRRGRDEAAGDRPRSRAAHCPRPEGVVRPQPADAAPVRADACRARPRRPPGPCTGWARPDLRRRCSARTRRPARCRTTSPTWPGSCSTTSATPFCSSGSSRSARSRCSRSRRPPAASDRVSARVPRRRGGAVLWLVVEVGMFASEHVDGSPSATSSRWRRSSSSLSPSGSTAVRRARECSRRPSPLLALATVVAAVDSSSRRPRHCPTRSRSRRCSSSSSATRVRPCAARALVAPALLAGFALLPRRLLVALPVAIFALAARRSVSASREVAKRADVRRHVPARRRARLGRRRRRRAGGATLHRRAVLERHLPAPVLEPEHHPGLLPLPGARCQARFHRSP